MEGQHPERQISQKSDSKHFQNTFKLDKNHNDLLFLSYPYRKSLLASIAILLTFSFLLVLLFFIFIFFPACTDKLIANDPSFVELSLERLGDDFDLGSFVHALRANSTVKHVCFSGTFVRELQDAQWRLLLQSIGQLATLEELQIWCSTIPTAVFAETIQAAQSLQKVYFFRVGLEGTQADFDALAEAIAAHPNLRDVRIGGFHILEPNQNQQQQQQPLLNNDIQLDRVVQALATAPKLEVVSLQLSSAQQAVPFGTDAIAQLLASDTITDLYLSRLGLGEGHLAVIAQGLAVNTTLRVLDLFGNTIENPHVMAMANALAQNNSVEILVLPCPANDLSVEACAAISEALKKNNKLTTLNLPRSNLSDEGITHLAQGLTVNKTLKKVEVGVSKTVGDTGINALMDMLDKNYKLERMVVSSADQSIKEKTEYYMRLNEVGRGNLLASGKATREQWVEMLITVQNDLDCLFYFISSNPTLCQFANVQRASVIVTEELRIRRRHTFGGYPDYGTSNKYSVERDMDEPYEPRTRRASAF